MAVCLFHPNASPPPCFTLDFQLRCSNAVFSRAMNSDPIKLQASVLIVCVGCCLVVFLGSTLMASTTSQSTVTKTFTQELSNSCNIHASQLPKLCLKDLKAQILKFWETNAPWCMVSLGNGYFEFIFSSINDLSAIRSIGSWNLSPGALGIPLALDEA
ncbi:hypothetical protein L195_g034318 [Trifolium pratense]|uniref:Pectin acetylesterase n=1 Tax=Trifolium pratense TaxID=57577 RepID=A0A2K3LIH3_TRIPR|nr:hypothetical protein L195_g034318 [Trifolium pratense]